MNYNSIEVALIDQWLALTGTGCVVLDAQFNIVMVNPTAGKLIGLDASSCLGQSAKMLSMRLKDAGNLEELIWRRNNDTSVRVTRLVATRLQHLQFKAVDTQLLAGSNESFRVLSVTDITQSVQMEQELASHHRRWQALNAGVVLVSVDEPDLPIVYVNSVFEKMTGYTARECVGRNCRFLQGSLQDQPGLVAIREALMQKRNGYGVLRNFRKDGSEFLNELFISPVHDAVGKLTHFLGVQHLRAE